MSRISSILKHPYKSFLTHINIFEHLLPHSIKEYPSTVVMLLREIKYGINITFSTIEIDPFGPTTYTYDIGNVYVSYDSKKSVKINVPGNRMVDYRITNMGSKVEYEIMVTDCKQEEKMGLMSDATATTDARGVLLFQAKTGCLVSAKAKK